MTLKLKPNPRFLATGERAVGYDPAWYESGEWRTKPYAIWLQEQAEKAGLEGRTFHSPERKPDGTVDGISHIADRDELAEMFASLSRMVKTMPGGNDFEADEKRKAAEFTKNMGSLAKRAAVGDGNALAEATKLALMQLRASDPAFPGGVATPEDFAAQFAQPLDTTELIPMCSETTMARVLPDKTGDTKAELWRELNELEFVSGSAHKIAFPAGDCPEDFRHNGDNKQIDLKHYGAKKSLTESDIRHSRGSIAAGYGITNLVGPFSDNGAPGERDVASLVRANISDLKEKEMQLMSILVMNDFDKLLVYGDEGTYPDEFDGWVTQITAANGARVNGGTSTGTFDVNHFNQFMAAGCAKPDAIFAHPVILADIALSYHEIGSQVINFDRNQNVVAGIAFASEVMTSYGPVSLIGDSNFPVTDNGNGTVTGDAYPVKLRHNGEPLIYRRTQIPLSFKDLAPGCTAIQFEIYGVAALIVKAMCAQAKYRAVFGGLVQNGCTYIDPEFS